MPERDLRREVFVQKQHGEKVSPEVGVLFLDRLDQERATGEGMPDYVSKRPLLKKRKSSIIWTIELDVH
jgi:hypothetical protein